jgi:hypothetical protein
MLRQTEVIVCAQIDYLSAVSNPDCCALRRYDYPLVFICASRPYAGQLRLYMLFESAVHKRF